MELLKYTGICLMGNECGLEKPQKTNKCDFDEYRTNRGGTKMTTIEQLKQEFDDNVAKLQADFDKRIKDLEQPKPKRRVLKYNEWYYYIDDEGDIVQSFWTDTESDNKRLQLNNIFRTKNEAKFELERRKVFEEVE